MCPEELYELSIVSIYPDDELTVIDCNYLALSKQKEQFLMIHIWGLILKLLLFQANITELNLWYSKLDFAHQNQTALFKKKTPIKVQCNMAH